MGAEGDIIKEVQHRIDGRIARVVIGKHFSTRENQFTLSPFLVVERSCCPQRLRPTGIHPCNNALRSLPYLIDFEVGRSFSDPQVLCIPTILSVST